MHKILLEQKNLTIYKKLLSVLGEWCDNVPGTGMNTWLDKLIEKGVSAVPSDKRAKAILTYVLEEFTVPVAVQYLTNWNFSDLSYDLKPKYKLGTKHLVAFWNSNKITDCKIKTLLNVEGKAGHWSDAYGKKVTLIDITKDNDE